MFDYAKHLRLQVGTPAKHRDAACRNVIGRSYYAVFHLLRDRQVGDGPRDGSVHGRVLRATDDVYGRRVGQRLSELKDLRNAADYRLDDRVLVRHADAALKHAAAIFEAVNRPHAISRSSRTRKR